MSSLKLLALDDEDLRIVSAHVQDAVLKVGEIDFRAREKRLVLPMNLCQAAMNSSFSGVSTDMK